MFLQALDCYNCAPRQIPLAKKRGFTIISHELIFAGRTNECPSINAAKLNATIRHPMNLIFDIGTHEGDDFRRFRGMGFNVVGVDANMDHVQSISLEFSGDKHARCLCAAISDAPGISNFYIDPTQSEWSSLERNIAGRNGTPLCQRSVATITLDQLFRHFGLPFYLKLDIEGGEINALRGMSSAAPEFISLEFEHTGLTEEQLLMLLRDKGYQSYAWRHQVDNLTRGYGEELIWHDIGDTVAVPSPWCDLFASTHHRADASTWRDQSHKKGTSLANATSDGISPQILFAVLSHGNDVAARTAVKETWLAAADRNTEAVFAIYPAHHAPSAGAEAKMNGAKDTIQPLGFASLFAELINARRFDWLCFCDDHVYVNTKELSGIAAAGRDFSIIESGQLEDRGRCLLLSRNLVEKLAADQMCPSYPNLVELLAYVTAVNSNLCQQDSRLAGEALLGTAIHQQSSPCVFKVQNPQALHLLHATLTMPPDLEIPVTHSAWSDSLLFYANGTFCRKNAGEGGMWFAAANGNIILKWFHWSPEVLNVGLKAIESN